MKSTLIILVAALVVGCSATAKIPDVPDPPKELPAGHLAPPHEWMVAYYRDFLPARDELDKLQREAGITKKADEVNGVALRVFRAVPQGFTFDETTRTFKPIEQPKPAGPVEGQKLTPVPPAK